MMNFMRPANLQQIPVIGFEGFETVMDKPIVKNKIDHAISADSHSYPKAVVQCNMPKPHQPQSYRGKYNTEQVIQLKPAMLLLVMCFMDEPQRPME